MRFVDRFLVILVGLAFISVITVLALVPEAIIIALESIKTLSLFLRLALVIAVNILVLVLLYLQLRVRRQPSDGLEVKASGAFTDVSVQSARTLILNAVNAVPDVTAADATVRAVEGRADVDLNIQVAGNDIHIPEKQREINRALRQVINKQLGLRMRGRPRVHIALEGEHPEQGADKTPEDVGPEPEVTRKQEDEIVSRSSEQGAVSDTLEARVDGEDDVKSADRQEIVSDSEPGDADDNGLDDHLSKLSGGEQKAPPDEEN